MLSSFSPIPLSIEFGYLDLVRLTFKLLDQRLIRFWLRLRDFWVHCSSHRMLLLGHHLNMKTSHLNFTELSSNQMVIFNSSTHHWMTMIESFPITVLYRVLGPSKSDLELQLQNLILNQVIWSHRELLGLQVDL